MGTNKNWSKAATSSKSWQPGRRVVDETSGQLSTEMLRELLQGTDVLPYEERFAPTRWLFKMAYEAVNGKTAPLATLWGAFRTASDNNNLTLDVYRKLSGEAASPTTPPAIPRTAPRARPPRRKPLPQPRPRPGDFGSSLDEVTGTGNRAHERCARSYVVSAQLRRWLHEVPTFVPIPAGWQPPELDAPPAAPPGPHAHAPPGGRTLAGAGGGARSAGRERGDEPAPPVRAFDDVSAAWGSGGGGGGGGGGGCGGSGYGSSSGGGGRAGRGSSSFAAPTERRAASPPARAPRTLIEAPEWADERTASQLLLEGVLGEVRLCQRQRPCA